MGGRGRRVSGVQDQSGLRKQVQDIQGSVTQRNPVLNKERKRGREEERKRGRGKGGRKEGRKEGSKQAFGRTVVRSLIVTPRKIRGR